MQTKISNNNNSLFSILLAIVCQIVFIINSFSQTTIDNQTYNYGSTNNQLQSITDVVNASTSTIDIDNQAGTNYAYTAIGQLSKDEAEGILSIEWNASGKVKHVSLDDNNDLTEDRTLDFLYDAMGNRIKKTETILLTAKSTITFYSRSATGELMALYKNEGSGLKRIEVPLSIGNDNTSIDATASLSTTHIYTRTLANKSYELKDQLGTVRTVITDTKEPDGSGTFKASIASISDNYAFGMELPGRSYNSSNYRYGFQGKEKDDELKGSGNSYDFGARLYDPRVGRWLSTDPLADKYPSESSYEAMGNNPIVFVDPDGKSIAEVLTSAFKGSILYLITKSTNVSVEIAFIANGSGPLKVEAFADGVGVGASAQVVLAKFKWNPHKECFELDTDPEVSIEGYAAAGSKDAYIAIFGRAKAKFDQISSGDLKVDGGTKAKLGNCTFRIYTDGKKTMISFSYTEKDPRNPNRSIQITLKREFDPVLGEWVGEQLGYDNGMSKDAMLTALHDRYLERSKSIIDEAHKQLSAIRGDSDAAKKSKEIQKKLDSDLKKLDESYHQAEAMIEKSK